MSECPCVELRATNPTPTLTECAPCVSLRCPDDQLTEDQATDLWNIRQCATAECPDHTGQVERCVNAGAFGTTLFNATQEQIDDAQAALNAAALAEAQRLANAALNCPPSEFENTLQSYNPCGSGYDTNLTDIAINAEGLYMEDGVAYAAAGFYTASTQAEANALALAAATAFGNDHFLDLNCCNCAGSGLESDLSLTEYIDSVTMASCTTPIPSGGGGGTEQMYGGVGAYTVSSAPASSVSVECVGYCPLELKQLKFVFNITSVSGTVEIYVPDTFGPPAHSVTTPGIYEVPIEQVCGYNLRWQIGNVLNGSCQGTVSVEEI